MEIEFPLFAIGSIITLILTSTMTTTSMAYGQSIFPNVRNPTTNSVPSSSHASTTLVPTKQHSVNTPSTISTLSLAHKPRPNMIKIVSPSNGQQALVGKPLMISRTSAGNTNATSINCHVSVIVNGIKPYQLVMATGPGGHNDYSKWNFTLSPKYTSIKQGPNKITAKYSCTNSPDFYSSISVIGSSSGTIKVYETTLKLRYAHFVPIPTSTNSKERQVKVIVNYTAANTAINNKTINAMMKVYAPNGTLIKTSSFRNGFVAKSSGTVQLATTIKDSRIPQLTAVVQFMTRDKLLPLSNPVTVKLIFGQKIGTKP
jgi:hypothetical protein